MSLLCVSLSSEEEIKGETREHMVERERGGERDESHTTRAELNHVCVYVCLGARLRLCESVNHLKMKEQKFSFSSQPTRTSMEMFLLTLGKCPIVSQRTAYPP